MNEQLATSYYEDQPQLQTLGFQYLEEMKAQMDKLFTMHHHDEQEFSTLK